MFYSSSPERKEAKEEEERRERKERKEGRGPPCLSTDLLYREGKMSESQAWVRRQKGVGDGLSFNHDNSFPYDVWIPNPHYSGISSQIRTKLYEWAALAGKGRLLLSGSIVLK